MASQPAELWDNAAVLSYLIAIDLEELVPIFKEQKVHGEDLVSLTDSELKADLNITRLQARRIKRYLADGGASFHKEAAAEQAPSYPAVPAAGTLPFSESPDLLDRDAMRAVTGSFSRATALGLPVEVVHVDAAAVQKYSDTVKLIAQLDQEQVTVRLPAAKEALEQLEKRLRAEQRKYEELQETSAERQKEAKELMDDKWYPGKFMGGSEKRNAKLEKAQGEAADMARKVQACGAVLEGLYSHRAAQVKQLEELRHKAAQLQQARQWEESVLPQIFAGATGDARENALEQHVDALVPQLQQARQYQTSYSQAYELLRSARKQLSDAQQAFQQAYGLATVDVVNNLGLRHGGLANNTPLGVMGDIAKRAQARQGASLASSACDAIIKAKAIIPGMPNVKLEDVKAVKGLGLMDIAFDNFVADMVVRQKIGAAMKQVEHMIPDVVAAERWLEGWLKNRVQPDLRAIEAEYAAKKHELDSYRRELMQEQVKKAAAAQ